MPIAAAFWAEPIAILATAAAITLIAGDLLHFLPAWLTARPRLHTALIAGCIIATVACGRPPAW